jgi:hypothetical protein
MELTSRSDGIVGDLAGCPVFEVATGEPYFEASSRDAVLLAVERGFVVMRSTRWVSVARSSRATPTLLRADLRGAERFWPRGGDSLRRVLEATQRHQRVCARGRAARWTAVHFRCHG